MAEIRHSVDTWGVEWVSNGCRMGVDGYRIGVGIEVEMSKFMVKCDISIQN
jgi:hypothetical protein